MDKDALLHQPQNPLPMSASWKAQRELSEQIARQTDEYLRRGGKIQELESGETGTGKFSFEEIELCALYIGQNVHNVEIARRMKLDLVATAQLMDSARKFMNASRGGKSAKKSRRESK